MFMRVLLALCFWLGLCCCNYSFHILQTFGALFYHSLPLFMANAEPFVCIGRMCGFETPTDGATSSKMNYIGADKCDFKASDIFCMEFKDNLVMH